jgi:hypothetical protein
LLAVAFDRRAIDPETPGGFGLGDAPLNRLYDLLSEVKRVSTPASTIPGALSSQSAVRGPTVLSRAIRGNTTFIARHSFLLPRVRL